MAPSDNFKVLLEKAAAASCAAQAPASVVDVAPKAAEDYDPQC